MYNTNHYDHFFIIIFVNFTLSANVFNYHNAQ